MTTPDIRHQIETRLADLYERHASRPADAQARYYTSGRGYHAADPSDAQGPPLAISLVNLDAEIYCAGASDVRFPMQSISKVFTYALALEDHGRSHVMTRVGVEPSGDSYRSILFDERAMRPYNPMVNAGALVAVDLVKGAGPEQKLERILTFMRRMSGNDSLDVDWGIFDLEMQTRDRNRATAYLLRSEGMILGDADECLARYLQQCSVVVDCVDLAVMAATLANGGVNPRTGERVLAAQHVRDVLTVMYTCGMYDFAGEWAFEVGLPAKGGVSGGILVSIPGKLGVAVFSPGLDRHGNSIRGVEACRELSGRLGLHVFASEDQDAMLRLRPPLPDLD